MNYDVVTLSGVIAPYMYFRMNPNNYNEAILAWGDVTGCVNAINFISASIALFERPAQPAGGKQGEATGYAITITSSAAN